MIDWDKALECDQGQVLVKKTHHGDRSIMTDFNNGRGHVEWWVNHLGAALESWMPDVRNVISRKDKIVAEIERYASKGVMETYCPELMKLLNELD